MSIGSICNMCISTPTVAVAKYVHSGFIFETDWHAEMG